MKELGKNEIKDGMFVELKNNNIYVKCGAAYYRVDFSDFQGVDTLLIKTIFGPFTEAMAIQFIRKRAKNNMEKLTNAQIKKRVDDLNERLSELTIDIDMLKDDINDEADEVETNGEENEEDERGEELEDMVDKLDELVSVLEDCQNDLADVIQIRLIYSFKRVLGALNRILKDTE